MCRGHGDPIVQRIPGLKSSVKQETGDSLLYAPLKKEHPKQIPVWGALLTGDTWGFSVNGKGCTGNPDEGDREKNPGEIGHCDRLNRRR